MTKPVGGSQENSLSTLPTQSHIEDPKVNNLRDTSKPELGLLCNWGTQESHRTEKPKLVRYQVAPNRFFDPQIMISKKRCIESDSEDENDPFSARSLFMEDSYSGNNVQIRKRKEFLCSRNFFNLNKFRNHTSRLALYNCHEKHSFTPVVDPQPLTSSEELNISHSEPSPSLPPEKKEPQQIGFPNLGNTCFINATLQALLAISEFSKQLEEAFSTNNDANNIVTLLNKIAYSRKAVLEADVCSALMQFRHSLTDIHPSYSMNIQQDASEFLIRLLEHIEVSSPDDNPVKSVFDFQVAEIRTCSSCGASTERLDTQSLLCLPISEERTHALADCLHEYCSMDDQRSLVCPKCSHPNAVVNNKLASLPQVLILSLNRYTPQNEKVTHSIFPPPVLNVGPFLQKQVNECELYDLKSLILHEGSFNDSGHYLTYAYCETDNQWFRYDDWQTHRINGNNIHDPNFELNQHGYVYFYQRRDTRPE